MSSVVQFVKKHPYLTVASTVLVVGGLYYYADKTGEFERAQSPWEEGTNGKGPSEKERQEKLHQERIAKNRAESLRREELRRKQAQEEAERKLEASRQEEELASLSSVTEPTTPHVE